MRPVGKTVFSAWRERRQARSPQGAKTGGPISVAVALRLVGRLASLRRFSEMKAWLTTAEISPLATFPEGRSVAKFSQTGCGLQLQIFAEVKMP